MPKSSNTPFTYYTFRYDYDDEVVRDKIISYIKREFPKYAIFDEISEEVKKKHIQGKIGKAMSSEQIRKLFKKEFPNIFCKSNYSIKDIVKPDEYDSYICKDGEVLLNNVFDDDYIAEQVKKREDNKKIYQAKVVKSKSAATFTQKLFTEFRDDYTCEFNTIYTYSYMKGISDHEMTQLQQSKEVLLNFILKRLGNLVKVFDTTVLQRIYNGIKNAIESSDEDGALRATNYYKTQIVL